MVRGAAIALLLSMVPMAWAETTPRQRQEAFLAPGLREPLCRLWVRSGSSSVPLFCLRFVDNGDGTVTDRHTGLTWLRDASCSEIPRTDSSGRAVFADAAAGVSELRDGMCGLTDRSRPGDWRLPNEADWRLLIDRAEANGCLAPGPFIPDETGFGCWSEDDPFTRVLETTYWSSTTDGGLPPRVMVAILFYGNLFGGSPFFKLQVWPVRSSEGAPAS